MSESTDNILASMLNDVQSGYDTSVGSFYYDVLYGVARRIAKLYERIEDVEANMYVATSEGDILTGRAADMAVNRNDSVTSAGVLRFTGERGAIVNKGALAASDNILFVTDESVTIPEDGFADVGAKCYSPGSMGNVAAGKINRFPVTLPGITAVTNPEPFTGGADEEGDIDLKNRYYEKVQNPHTTGNAADYKAWISEEVDGVGNTDVIECWNGGGTVKIIITSASGDAASEELIAEVKECCEKHRPIGADVTVVSAEEISIKISVNLVAEDKETAKEQITEAVNAYLKSNKLGYISYAEIGARIIGCSAVEDYSLLRLNGTTSNVILEKGKIPVLKEVTVT